MSEAQAAIALMSLEDFPENRKNNQALYRKYEKHLADIPGLRLVQPSGVSYSNYQYLVCIVDELQFGLSRDQLLALVKAENINARRYFYPGVHRTVPYAEQFPQYLNQLPNTDEICASCIQFPIGALVSPQAVERICNVLSRIQRSSALIRAELESVSAMSYR
jgi:dTDP-4-amino-4,6-dideoxygalactose transaminase